MPGSKNNTGSPLQRSGLPVFDSVPAQGGVCLGPEEQASAGPAGICGVSPPSPFLYELPKNLTAQSNKNLCAVLPSFHFLWKSLFQYRQNAHDVFFRICPGDRPVFRRRAGQSTGAAWEIFTLPRQRSEVPDRISDSGLPGRRQARPAALKGSPPPRPGRRRREGFPVP